VAKPLARLLTDVRTWVVLAAMLSLGGVVYGVWSNEWAGTALLVLVGAFAGIIGGYIAFETRFVATREGRETAALESAEHYLPHQSVWPLELGAGMTLALSGFALGLWVLVPGLVLTVHSLVGWVRQSRTRS
jgi:Cytochrome c oxidase subunit IV